MRKGLTLIELMMVIVLFVLVAAAAVYVLRVVLLSWSSQESRAGVDISLDSAIENMVRDLREAKEVQSQAGRDEIRFTPDESTYYIYYLYNASDAYGPPPAFDQDSYELRKAALTGDIDGTFTYGAGQLILTDVVPPGTDNDPKSNLTTDLSVDADSVLTIILQVTRGDETITSKTKVKPRNL